MVARKLDLLPGHLGQNGQPVLDTQPFNLTVPQVAAVTDKLAPRGRRRTFPCARYQLRQYGWRCLLAPAPAFIFLTPGSYNWHAAGGRELDVAKRTEFSPICT